MTQLTGNTEFQLEPRLEHDCVFITDLELCRVLMMQDCRYPWFILVPRRANVSELYQLSDNDLAQFYQESAYVGKAIMQAFEGHKLNLAALGNVVNQLHVHHVVRYHHDPAWPHPIWGRHPVKPYSPKQLAERIAQARACLIAT